MLDWSAILGGLALGMGISIAAGIFIGIASILDLARSSSDASGPAGPHATNRPLPDDPEEARQQMMDSLQADSLFHVASLVISLLAQAIAGYFTASWADSAPFLHAAVMGGLAMAITFLFDWRSYGPAWLMWTWVLMAVPATLAGAWLATG